MPYKIFTYEDPYKLDKADFWDEISALPHFCGARTLVNGLKDVLGNGIKGLICPLDTLIEHQDVYRNWTNSIGLRIQQYSALTSSFKHLLETEQIDEIFHMALTQNQNHFLDAIRLFIELDISAAAIDHKKGNHEQRLFVYILNKAQNSDLFRFPATPSREKLKEIMVDIAEKEVKDCRGPQREAARCSRTLELTRQSPLNAVVVHGVHQFSPLQLRLLIAMEKMGLTIIFLFNYQKKYSKVYSSWNDIYGCFSVPIHHDTAVKEYQMPTMQNPSNALACAIGELCEGRYSLGNPKFRQWYQLYSGIELVEFTNITEYAHFVSNHFETAIRKYDESRSIMDRGNNVWDKEAVLRYLDEQVYTANRDVHTLLKIYYPDYAKDRHFLSYPIGQFFSAIYRLWDYDKGEIIIDSAAIKECLSSNVLRAAPGEVLLRTFCNVDILFERISTFGDFRREIASAYAANYDRVIAAKSTDAIFPLKQLSIYNKYKVAKKDILALIRAIEEINEIAAYLFALDNSRQDFINFRTHFKKLEEFLKQRDLSSASEQERLLIKALQLRLNRVKPEQSSFSGTFGDLKEGLHYYLKQDHEDDRGADWIVKNFEQIDGDILQSKRQFEQEANKTYHFACLSDRDMNLTVNDQLPWPLTDEFIRIAYSPIDLQFQVYYTALSERSNFLRYALFYGLCYNRSNVRLSYVSQYEDEVTEPYALLSLLGLRPHTGLAEAVRSSAPFAVVIKPEQVKRISYDRFPAMDMFLCPYRYFLDHVMADGPVVCGNFLYQKYYENLLVEAAWKRIEKLPKTEGRKRLDMELNRGNQIFRPYFTFWKTTEILDLTLRAKNYLAHQIIASSRGTTVPPYDPSHMQTRKLFGNAKFFVDISEVDRKHPYGKFESLTAYKYPSKEYSLTKIPKCKYKSQERLTNELVDEMKQYINQVNAANKYAIPAEWCTYCVHRGTCMDPYIMGD